MPALRAFTFLSLNGLYKGEGDDIGWHRHGEEEARYSEESLAAGHTLVFGRRTYDMMASFWPTPEAAEAYPAVAAGMNRSDKIVLSRRPFDPTWTNTEVVTGDIVAEMRKRKQGTGRDMTILGSGEIVSLFADAGLIDEFEIMIDPVAIPEGTRIFHGIRRPIDLRLVGSRVLGSGTLLLTYRPKE